jgi:hypothetical protein
VINTRETIENIFQQLVIPSGKRLDSISTVEGAFIYDWIKGHQLSATLEIGLALVHPLLVFFQRIREYMSVSIRIKRRII